MTYSLSKKGNLSKNRPILIGLFFMSLHKCILYFHYIDFLFVCFCHQQLNKKILFNLFLNQHKLYHYLIFEIFLYPLQLNFLFVHQH